MAGLIVGAEGFVFGAAAIFVEVGAVGEDGDGSGDVVAVFKTGDLSGRSSCRFATALRLDRSSSERVVLKRGFCSSRPPMILARSTRCAHSPRS